MLYRVHLAWAGVEITTLVVMVIDYTGSCKCKYHTITTTRSLGTFNMKNINVKFLSAFWNLDRNIFYWFTTYIFLYGLHVDNGFAVCLFVFLEKKLWVLRYSGFWFLLWCFQYCLSYIQRIYFQVPQAFHM